MSGMLSTHGSFMMSFSAARWMDLEQIDGWRFQHGCSTGQHALTPSFSQLGHLSA
jgi:hypothetical protein